MKNPFLLLEVKNKQGELHFRRYGIKTPWFGIFIHFIYKKDQEKHMHDHPWNYTSIMLKGSYCEETPRTPTKNYTLENIFPGEIHSNKAEHIHRIKEICVDSCLSPYGYKPPVITLFFTGPERRVWGYDVDGTWVDHITYRKNKRDGLYE